MYSPSLEETIFSNRFIARTVAVTLTALVLIVIGHLVFVILFPYSPLFIRFQVNVDQEGNFVTWWNSTLNLAAGIAAFLIAWLLARRPKDNRRSNRAWNAMGAMLVYIGIDDAAQIHEHTYGIFARVNAFLGQWVPYILEIGWYLWIPVLGIPAVILLLIVAKAIYKDLQANRTALILFGCGIVLLLTNPITEYVQAKLAEPETPAGAPLFAPQLLETDRDAWLQMQIADLTQEASEIAAVSCLLLSFLCLGREYLAPQKVSRTEPAFDRRHSMRHNAYVDAG